MWALSGIIMWKCPGQNILKTHYKIILYYWLTEMEKIITWAIFRRSEEEKIKNEDMKKPVYL